jgi:flagellar hook protein FlgE
MIQAMYSGISGMKAFKASLDVIGNNVANVNTVAYKSQKTSFKEMFSQTLRSASAPSDTAGGTNPSQVGLGVTVGSIDTDGTQGSLTATGQANDLAVEGNGYFAVSNGTRTYFTRDGSFERDAENRLVSSGTGLTVLGWTADATTGVLDTTAPITASSVIEIPVGTLSVARQTENVTLGGNLDASAAEGDTYSVEFSVYDSLGVTHAVNITFTKAPNGGTSGNQPTWTYEATCGECGAAPVGTGSIVFDQNGHSTTDSIDLSLTLTSSNGSVSPLLAEVGTRSVSQQKDESSVSMTYNDGLSRGTLESFSIAGSGLISGAFSNGATMTLGQLALAGFSNPGGLTKEGNSLYSESPNSGSANIGLPGAGGLGNIDSGYLEASNVDLAAEFATMIVAQRGYQANSKIITVSDEILDTLISLKR